MLTTHITSVRCILKHTGHRVHQCTLNQHHTDNLVDELTQFSDKSPTDLIFYFSKGNWLRVKPWSSELTQTFGELFPVACAAVVLTAVGWHVHEHCTSSVFKVLLSPDAERNKFAVFQILEGALSQLLRGANVRILYVLSSSFGSICIILCVVCVACFETAWKWICCAFLHLKRDTIWVVLMQRIPPTWYSKLFKSAVT